MKKRLLVGPSAIVLVVLLVGTHSTMILGYLDHQKRVKEVVLQQCLWTMRRAIDFFWNDKERPPESLQELVTAGYLREIPADPITESNQTWVVEREKESSVPNSPPGVIDVHSGAEGADSRGKPYNQY